MLNVKVKYHKKYVGLLPIEILKQGDFVDLRSAKDIELKEGDFTLIPLGVSMQLPEGYWGQVVPRSSTFKKYGIIQVNSFGVIDESYCGDNDEWFMPVYATRDTVIPMNERVCQFRIVKKEPFTISTVEVLGNEDRGGHGSTGRI